MPKRLGKITLLSLEEIQDELGVSERTLKRRMKAGQLRATKLGGTFWITEGDFLEFLSASAKYPGKKEFGKHTQHRSRVKKMATRIKPRGKKK